MIIILNNCAMVSLQKLSADLGAGTHVGGDTMILQWVTKRHRRL